MFKEILIDLGSVVMKQRRFHPQIDCTVGVIHKKNGLLFFKNRDLEREYIENRQTVLHSNESFYALQGIDLQTQEISGVSIGVNRHRICVANTHIESSQDLTYDILCEVLLQKAKKKADITDIVESFMQKNTLQGGRILVSSIRWSFLIEVYKQDYKMQEIDRNIAITNRFELISHNPQTSKVSQESSNNRLDVANRMIKNILTIGRLKAMLRSHIPEKGELSICNHRDNGGGTESSHIIQIQGDYMGWSSLYGYPCENDYATIQLFEQ